MFRTWALYMKKILFKSILFHFTGNLFNALVCTEVETTLLPLQYCTVLHSVVLKPTQKQLMGGSLPYYYFTLCCYCYFIFWNRKAAGKPFHRVITYAVGVKVKKEKQCLAGDWSCYPFQRLWDLQYEHWRYGHPSTPLFKMQPHWPWAR